jgi:hypothetical protein
MLSSADVMHSAPMKEMAFDMRNMLVQVQETLVSVPRNLTPWLQNALLLEDSLGYTLPVPLETISSWQVSFSCRLWWFLSDFGMRLFMWCSATSSSTGLGMSL